MDGEFMLELTPDYLKYNEEPDTKRIVNVGDKEVAFTRKFVVPFITGKKYTLGERYLPGPTHGECLIVQHVWSGYPTFFQMECKEDGFFWIWKSERIGPKVIIDGKELVGIQKLEFGCTITVELENVDERDIVYRFEKRETDLTKIEGRIEFKRRKEFPSIEKSQEDDLNLPSLAIEKIWSFLDYESVKMCRLVSKQWDANLTPVMLEKTRIKMDLTGDCPSSIIDQFVSDTQELGIIPAFNIKMPFIGEDDYSKKMKIDVFSRLIYHPPIQNLTEFVCDTSHCSRKDWDFKPMLKFKLGKNCN